ncbi:MAG: hypothetical protein A2498_04840 [Lentisphaerae bacterium RIFOXYC12_FULL_60_16]|nr:MAG: hypothetical protein A2498_04840 [Lentisphaerae bacterium RIFOXYC12_FULL_60_16]OGV77713.1 MAG: hypothetical protein A2340_11025 [Lentisphaerae bacterium RIFOXYB12_FULL_60_10]
MKTTKRIMQEAGTLGLAVPAFNIPYLPILKPVVQALRDTDTFGLIAVARLEWMKFEARSLEAVRDEYERWKDPHLTRLHLDHVPVVDEDLKAVDYRAVIAEALKAGYGSVMVDGSRLPLDQNIAATRAVADMAHAGGVPVEGELGAVMGHESGPLPPYDELFESGRGFTDPDEAVRFVRETGVDWLSVAIGNIHGAISGAASKTRKVQARLNLDHLRRIRDAVGIPLVLHGGSGIRTDCLQASFRSGIVKINVGTSIRQPFEQLRGQSVEKACLAVYAETVRVICDELNVKGSAGRLKAESGNQ